MVREEEGEVLKTFPCPFTYIYTHTYIKIYERGRVGVSPSRIAVSPFK